VRPGFRLRAATPRQHTVDGRWACIVCAPAHGRLQPSQRVLRAPVRVLPAAVPRCRGVLTASSRAQEPYRRCAACPTAGTMRCTAPAPPTPADALCLVRYYQHARMCVGLQAAARRDRVLESTRRRTASCCGARQHASHPLRPRSDPQASVKSTVLWYAQAGHRGRA
jgi:hypothetical protein